MNSRVVVGEFNEGATGVAIEVFIDGDPATYASNGSITPLTATITTLPSSTYYIEFTSIFSVFDDLSKGMHTVQLYAKTSSGTATDFGLDPGGWGVKFIVKETL